MSHAALVVSLSDEVLALLAASYGKSADQVVERIVTRQENPKAKRVKGTSKLAMVKAAAAQAALEARPTPRANQAPITVIALPPVGTYDARGFLIAMRRAVSRDEQIAAIAGYVGFDRHGEFGAQDLAARMTAQRALNGCQAGTRPVHTSLPSVAGYVAGMPDETAKRVANLKGRETLAAETMADHEKMASDDSVEATERSYHAQLAMVEGDRLRNIRQEIATLRG
jgi:hypothetical protein